MKSVLITGAAGFIGFHLQRKIAGKYNVKSMDLLDEKNIPAKKRAELMIGIEKQNILEPFLDLLQFKPDIVVHLAAETGIPNSLTEPQKYFETNVSGTFNVLEQCRKHHVKHFIYASSSSVYESTQGVMKESHSTNEQLSFYGTSKKLTETMIANYSRQFKINAIGLRFFTVYGSWTRPDMAAYKFLKAIDAEEEITLYNNGNIYRDFTHVSDIVNAIELMIEKMLIMNSSEHQILNIGYGNPISIKNFAQLIADKMNKELKIKSAPLPKNELQSTHADTQKLLHFIGYKPQCAAEVGVNEMVEWFVTNRYE